MMKRTDIIMKLNGIFRDVFDDETIQVKDEMTADDIEDWDSLAQITLIVQIESEFGFKFDMKEVQNFKNVGNMIDLIEIKGS